MAHGVQVELTGSGLGGVGRGFSPVLWDGYDPQAMDRDPSIGCYDQDDFMNPPTFPVSSAATLVSGRYTAFTSATSTIESGSTQGGALNLIPSSTANTEAYLQGGRSHVLASADEPGTGTYPYHHVARVRMETRFRVSSVANDHALFIGLGGQGVATAQLADTTGALVATFHGVGIQVLAAAGATVNVVYQENGSALQTPIAALATIAANVWYSFGMDFNPWARPTERCTFWWGGVKQSTALTHAQTIAATFPISTGSVQIPMGPTWLMKSVSTGSTLTLGGTRVCTEWMTARGNEACA
jgi:hypothetical protein